MVLTVYPSRAFHANSLTHCFIVTAVMLIQAVAAATTNSCILSRHLGEPTRGAMAMLSHLRSVISGSPMSFAAWLTSARVD
jgi:hypothetical protein